MRQSYQSYQSSSQHDNGDQLISEQVTQEVETHQASLADLIFQIKSSLSELQTQMDGPHEQLILNLTDNIEEFLLTQDLISEKISEGLQQIQQKEEEVQYLQQRVEQDIELTCEKESQILKTAESFECDHCLQASRQMSQLKQEQFQLQNKIEQLNEFLQQKELRIKEALREKSERALKTHKLEQDNLAFQKKINKFENEIYQLKDENQQLK